jgi:hypothetical protein
MLDKGILHLKNEKGSRTGAAVHFESLSIK